MTTKPSVLLIRPDFFQDRMFQNDYSIPPIGLLFLTSYLKKLSPEIPVEILDMRTVKNLTEFESILREKQPTIVGFTAFTFEIDFVKEYTRVARNVLPESFMVLGGPHANAYKDLLLDEIPELDFVVVGEGEITFHELVNACKEGTISWNDRDNSIAGLYYRKKDGQVSNNDERNLAEIDELCAPMPDLIDCRPYWSGYYSHNFVCQKTKKTWPVVFSRGCPFKCIFCHTIFSKEIRFRSVESITEEVKNLYVQGIEEIHIEDDCFNCDMTQAKAILRGIIDLNLPIHFAFPNGIRADRIDDELASLMKKAGVYYTYLGIESGSPRIQKVLKKSQLLSNSISGIEYLDQYDIISNVGIIIGNPTEDLEDLKMTQDFLMNTKATAATILSFVPFPGTSSYEDYKIKERFPEIPFQDYFTHYPFINLSKVPTKEILKMKRNLLFKFYLQPWRIFRLLWLYPNYKVFIFNVLKFFEFMLKVGKKVETSENIPIEKGKTLLQTT